MLSHLICNVIIISYNSRCLDLVFNRSSEVQTGVLPTSYGAQHTKKISIYVCRMPSEIWAKITTEWKSHDSNGDAVDLVCLGGMI